MRFVECLKSRCTPRELGELWNVGYKLPEEGYHPDGVEQRGIDPCHVALQMFADAFELRPSESGEDGGFPDPGETAGI